LTFIIAFILRVLPDISTSEPFEEEFYGMVLLVSVLLLLLVAMPVLTGMQIYRRYRFRSGLLDMPDGILVNVDAPNDVDLAHGDQLSDRQFRRGQGARHPALASAGSE
jgi:hypothetical protein